ncbi:histidinol-phosphate transaminase [Alcaligenaceae bacterium CGII-47]|nr:histidinol-phosphate transaminase [Alcaligenaceae bacterium CGII-47]
MTVLWSDHVADLMPYMPGEQANIPNLLKLNTNEHPYGPSPLAIAAIREAASEDLRLYPDYQALALRQTIAQRYGVTPDQVFLGNGSDEILAHAFNALFLRQGRPLLMPDVTYSFYQTYCCLYRVPHVCLPLADDFSIRISDYIDWKGEAPAGIIFANPNAPTGKLLGLDDIAAIVRAHPDSSVVVDEAYIDFGGRSAVELLAQFDNVLVIHTFSKSRSLAGLRVGYAMGSTSVIEALTRTKDSFNSYPIDRLAQAGARASMLDEAYFQSTRRAVMDARELLTQKMVTLGFNVLPSQANFVFARHPQHDARQIQRLLREQGVLVRHFQQPRIAEYLRITVGSPEDCERLCNALTLILDESH